MRARWLAAALVMLACGASAPPKAPLSRAAAPPSDWSWDLPPGFPPPRVPADNPMSRAKVALGRALFFDLRLSGPGTMACSSCHRPELAFTDGKARAVGVTGARHPRGAMSLANVAYGATLTWADPGLTALEDQALVPMLGEHPVEMGIAGREDEVLARLGAHDAHRSRFEAAFPDDDEPVTLANVTRAIAAFERTLISGDSPYDRFVYRDDQTALSPAARRGMTLFFSERLGCGFCHGGFTFSGPTVWLGSADAAPVFHNTGLYDQIGADGRRGAYPADNTGVHEHTGRRRDMGRFRAPTLRNIAVTAPYMHDGSIATLDDVIEHYAAGGRSASRRTSERLHGFALAGSDKADLIAFLHSLTDHGFLTNPRIQAP